MKLKNGIFLLLAAFIWGTTFVAQSIGNGYMGPVTFLFGRTVLAVIFLGVLVAARSMIRIKKNGGAPRSAAYKKRLVLAGFACGAPLFLASALQQAGMLETDVGKSGFLTALYIVLVPVLHFIVTRIADVKVWIAALVATAGIYFLCGTSGFTINAYDLLLIGCAFVFAVQILMVNHFSPDLDGIELSFAEFSVVLVFSAIFMFLTEQPALSQLVKGFGSIAYAGIMSSGVAYTLQIVGQKDQDPTISSLLMSFESVFSVLAGLVVLHQLLSGREIFGCVLMFVAILITQIPVPKRLTGLLVLCLCFSLTFSGCGQASGENLLEAQKLIEERNFTAAEEYLNQMMERGVTERQVVRLLAIAQMGQGKYEEAAFNLEQAISQSSISPEELDYDMNYYLAACYFKMEQYDKALEIYDAILGLKPNKVDAMQLRGTVRLAMGDLKGAKEDFEMAIKKEPRNFDRLITIFETLKAYGYEEEGKAYLQAALDKGESIGAFEIGRLSYYLEDYATAKSCLETARQGDEQDYLSTLLLGKTYEKLGNLSYAMDVYEAYLAADQSHPEIYNELGLCRLQAGDVQSALSAFQTGQKIRNNEIMQSLLYNEIVAYEKLGDFRKANLLMASYLKSYPEDKAAQREQIFLSTR